MPRETDDKWTRPYKKEVKKKETQNLKIGFEIIVIEDFLQKFVWVFCFYVSRTVCLRRSSSQDIETKWNRRSQTLIKPIKACVSFCFIIRFQSPSRLQFAYFERYLAIATRSRRLQPH